MFGGCVHTREIRLKKNELYVNDTLRGKYRTAASRFYLHPDLKSHMQDGILKIEGPGVVIFCDFKGKKASLKESSWHPQFGVCVPNNFVEVEFENDVLEISFKWHFK